MVDVDSVLRGVEERDKWRGRLVLLERSLVEVLERRRRLENRLRRLRKELARLRLLSTDTRLAANRPFPTIEVTGAPRSPLLR
jgi:predicted  nucleic acid-binding Zn-ribbon protein